MPAEGTASTILALLREGRQQAQDLAERLAIDTSAVRRHLETLRADGLVDTEDIVIGPGRPKKMYGLTAAGREAFPRDYALLLDLILSKLRETGDRKRVEALMSSIAQDLARTLPPHDDLPGRVHGLVAFYQKLGFEAEATRTKDGYAFTQRNCIFLKTAQADPALLCQCFDEGIMRAALPGAEVTFDGSLATGALRCRHLIQMPRRANS